MASADSAQRHRALASIYHHGRQHAFVGGRARTGRLMPLEQAVTVLLSGDDADKATRRHVQLALAELWRTGTGTRDARVEAQIRRLASWHGGVPDLADSRPRVAGSGVDAKGVDAKNDAYTAALKSMLRASPGLGLKDEQIEAVSYKVTKAPFPKRSRRREPGGPGGGPP